MITKYTSAGFFLIFLRNFFSEDDERLLHYGTVFSICALLTSMIGTNEKPAQVHIFLMIWDEFFFTCRRITKWIFVRVPFFKNWFGTFTFFIRKLATPCHLYPHLYQAPVAPVQEINDFPTQQILPVNGPPPSAPPEDESSTSTGVFDSAMVSWCVLFCSPMMINYYWNLPKEFLQTNS